FVVPEIERQEPGEILATHGFQSDMRINSFSMGNEAKNGRLLIYPNAASKEELCNEGRFGADPDRATPSEMRERNRVWHRHWLGKRRHCLYRLRRHIRRRARTNRSLLLSDAGRLRFVLLG